MVLLGVEHFQQRRGGITAHVATHLVDLVEQEQRVAHADLGHLLDQATRHGANIGTAVTADLGLVTNATQGHAHELAVGGVSNGLGQRSLADTGRADQAENRALDLLHPFLNGEVLEDTLLHFLQPVMVGIEDVLGLGQVQTNLALGLPRYIDQPIDVGTHHGRFGRHRRHLLELVQLGSGLGERVFRQAGGIDALFQLFDFVMTFVAVTELFLNGLHLLIQVVLALAALHLLLDAAADTLLDLQQVDFSVQQRQYVLDTLGKLGQLEDFLLLLDLQRHMGGHGVYQAARLVDAVQRGQHLGRHLLAQLDVLFELTQEAANEYFGLALAGIDLVYQADFGTTVAIHFAEALDGATLLTLDQHFHGAVRQFQQLQDSGNGAHAIQSVFARVVIGRIPLGNQKNLLVPRHRGLERLDGFLAPHE
ncbi:hypothetical protein D3C84_287760 [compost metagenome]